MKNMCTDTNKYDNSIGQIIDLYATVLEGEEYSYAEIYDTKEEAESRIGEYVDGYGVFENYWFLVIIRYSNK